MISLEFLITSLVVALVPGTGAQVRPRPSIGRTGPGNPGQASHAKRILESLAPCRARWPHFS